MKPWMKNKPGETNAERVRRLEYTCYNCGKYIRNWNKLQKHSDECKKKEKK